MRDGVRLSGTLQFIGIHSLGLSDNLYQVLLNLVPILTVHIDDHLLAIVWK